MAPSAVVCEATAGRCRWLVATTATAVASAAWSRIVSTFRCACGFSQLFDELELVEGAVAQQR
ncbi:hypothetical protein [Streptomyces sp. NBC_00576]|uniref:hypothetical protein n=1 Tax=Streptomyces sp. NBC_00576 TaxID=2903665 RepID=UPI002E7FE203|nr:hypothetical protein [Streptomyces sp. NBC_00576]WUB75692.1 hypothetical protein OG734_39680 [Streptomyces sp. NBC_00576]